MGDLRNALNQRLTKDASLTGGKAGASRLLKAKKTGKMVGQGSSPRASNVAEQFQARQSALNLGQVEEQAKERSSALAQQEQSLQKERDIQRQTLEVDKDIAASEQASQELALADRKYTDKLQLWGNEILLENGILNEELYTKAALGESHQMFIDMLGYKDILGKQNIDNEVVLAKLEAEWSRHFEKQDWKAEQKRKKWEGITGGIGQGLGALA